MPWLYTTLRKVFRQGAKFYFLDLETAGEVNAPTHGATIFAANHPGSIMDVVVLGAVVPRTIHYLARSGLFAHLPARLLLQGAGAIPVYRRQDAKAGEQQDNTSAFAAAHHVLNDGKALGIFPEGMNAPLRHVRDIKTGCARIALEAAAASGFQKEVRIVPVGINYEERDRFLSKVLVRFGEAIVVNRYAEQYEASPREAVQALTQKLQDAMREAAVHIDEEHEALAESLDTLIGEELEQELAPSVDVRSIDARFMQHMLGRGGRQANLDGRFRVRQWIADAIQHFARHDPRALDELRRAVDRYRWRLYSLRLGADFRDGRASVRRTSLGILLYAVLLAPLALYGLAHNFVPYRFARRFAMAAPDEAMIAIRAFGGGLAFFGAAYAAFYALAAGAADHWWRPLLYVASLPVAGVWFMRYRRRLQKMRERLVFSALFQRKRASLSRLVIERTQLLSRIDLLRQRYERHLAAGATDEP